MNDLRKRFIRYTLAVCGIILLFGLIGFTVETLAMLDLSKLTDLMQTTDVYDAQGTRVSSLSGSENRIAVPLASVPQHVRDAFIAAEDARFARHIGVDPIRIGGAIVENIRSGGYAQGASTITQQLIKRTHLTSEKHLLRKMREAILAIRLEMLLTKDEILERYLNAIYFGNGAYGVEAAARAYFGVSTDALTLPQGATLAAIVKAPSRYDPRADAERVKTRRDYVLNEMARLQLIDAQAAEAAIAAPLELAPKADKAASYPWYIETAADEACAALEIDYDALLTGGYRLYTALDPAIQREADALFRMDNYFPDAASDGTAVQAALLCMEPGSGAITAVVGGRSHDVARGLNRAIGMRRQPGSAFKPISTYLAAIDRFGYLPVSFVDDTKRAFAGGYAPRNISERYFGMVTLREALARSLNVASVDLLSRIGISAARDYSQRAGIALLPDDSNLALGLGALTEGVSPASLCAAYLPLANGGIYRSPHALLRVEDAAGQEIWRYRDDPRRVCSPQSAYLVTDMLRSAVSYGSARALAAVGGDVAAKTGTVGEPGGGNRDVWTIAYSETRAVAVWMGFDQPSAQRKLPDSVTGGSHTARLAAALLSRLPEDGARFSIPDTLVEVLLDERALALRHAPMLAGALTPKALTRVEPFPRAAVPTAVSDVWEKPTPAFDFMARETEDGVLLTCTAVDDFALYRLFRGDTQIAELTGKAGDPLRYLDFGTTGRDTYRVVPTHAELWSLGVTLEAEASVAAWPYPGEIQRGATDESAAPPYYRIVRPVRRS